MFKNKQSINSKKYIYKLTSNLKIIRLPILENDDIYFDKIKKLNF